MDSIYDDILEEIGNEGKYQKRFGIIYNLIFIVLWDMAYNNIILALAVTPHTCKVPDMPHNMTEEEWKVINIPRLDDTMGRNKFDSCSLYTSPYENNKTKACQEYTFDKTWYDNTVPSEYNWVCDKEIIVANVLAYTKIAELLGTIFFGWFGDRYGRRYTYIIAIVMLVVGRIISVLAGKSYMIFLIGCYVTQIPSWSAPLSLMSISIEMSSFRRRSTINSLCFISCSLGHILLGLLFWWLRDWKIFVIVTTAPLVPYIIMSWKMIESPRWLYTQGKKHESLKQLKRIAKVNKKIINMESERNILANTSIDKPPIFRFFMLFAGWRLTMFTTLLTMILFLSVLNYGFLLFSSGEKSESNPFLEFSWQALTGIPSIYFSAWIADRIGRRYTGISSFSFVAVAWVIIAIRENNSNEWIGKWWIGSLLTILAKFMANITMVVLILLKTEIYPTSLRQTGLAFGNIFFGVSLGLCPYLLYLGRNFNPQLPGIILAVTSTLGAISFYFLPETLNAKLPETVEEAQQFGIKGKKYNRVQLQPKTA